MFGARGNDVVIVVSFWINRRVIYMVYRLSDNQICGATSSKVSRECCGSTLKKMNSTNVMACVTHLHSGPFLEPLVMYRWSLCSTFPSRCLLPGGLSFDLGMDGDHTATSEAHVRLNLWVSILWIYPKNGPFYTINFQGDVLVSRGLIFHISLLELVVTNLARKCQTRISTWFRISSWKQNGSRSIPVYHHVFE